MEVNLTEAEIGMLIQCVKTTFETADFSDTEEKRGLELKEKLEQYLYG